MAFSQQVKLEGIGQKVKRDTKAKINRPASVDEAHNIKEAMTHMNNMKKGGAGKLGTTKDGATTYVAPSGALINSKKRK